MLNELDLDRCERQRSRHSTTVITVEEWTEGDDAERDAVL